MKFLKIVLIVIALFFVACGDDTSTCVYCDSSDDEGNLTDESFVYDMDHDKGGNPVVDNTETTDEDTEEPGLETELITIPAGPFWMGCNIALDDQCLETEKPYHEVTIPEFSIERYEVTVEQYEHCIDVGDCDVDGYYETSKDGEGYSNYCNLLNPNRLNHPVNCITWAGAKAYCEWIGRRLPSASEWEKSARGGCELYDDCETESRTYPWGEVAPDCSTTVMDALGDWGCGKESTDTVGSHDAGNSPYNISDMAGNVSEWTADDWHEDYTGAPTDGTAWTGGGAEKVTRGGGWIQDGDHEFRVNTRYHTDVLNEDSPYLRGFRCATSD